MVHRKINYRVILILLMGSILLFSCKKKEATSASSQNSCSPNNGYFSITVEGVDYDMVVDNTTHFSILYNWYGKQFCN